MDGVLELNIIVVTFLEERLGIDHVLADGTGLPRPVGARGIDLVERRAGDLVEAGDKEGDAKGAHAAALGELLHDTRDLLDEDAGRRILTVDALIFLSGLAGLADEDTKVWAHSRVDHADIRADQ